MARSKQTSAPHNAAPDGPARRGGGNGPQPTAQASDQVHDAPFDEAVAAGSQGGERVTERRAPTKEERVTERQPQTTDEMGQEGAGSPDDGMAGSGPTRS